MKSPLVVAAALLLSAVTGAAAQAPAWDHGTSLAVSTGAARADGTTGAAVGGSVSWELTTYFAIEGAGRWMDRGTAPGAYAGEVGARVGLGGTRDSAMPYVMVGVGAQRRAFDVHDQGEAAGMPEFYRRRLTLNGNAVGAHQTFTDPALVAGAGVDVALTRTLALRPDVRALVVFGDGQRNTVVVATVSLAYRFDHRPVTPTRLPRRDDR